MRVLDRRAARPCRVIRTDERYTRAVRLLLALVMATSGCASEPVTVHARSDAARPSSPPQSPRPVPPADAGSAPTPTAAPTAIAADAGAPADGGLAVLAIPTENRVRGPVPDPSTAEAGARRLLEAIRSGDPTLAHDFFFPADAFDLVKDMPVPGRYLRRLLAWYDEDLRAEHDRLGDAADLVFDRFQLGHCTWMEIHTEGNKLPYWSCHHSILRAHAGDHARSFEVHVIINWGQRWYVTHLGEIRH
jgi:hypothetical protein